MALVLEVNGSPVQFVKGTAFCSKILGGRDTFRCSINSENQSYRIQQDDEVVFRQTNYPAPLDNFVLFKGFATTPREHGIGNEGIIGITNQLNAQGLTALTDRRVITATIPAGTTLDTILSTYVEPLLTPFGLSFDAVAMPSGPTIADELVYKNRLLTEAINEWITLTGWVFRTDYNTDKFYMFEPGSLIGFDIDDQTDTFAVGDVEVERVTLRPANRIIVNAGSSASGAPQNVHDSFTATAGQTVFPLRYQMAPGNILGWNHNGVIYVNGFQERVDIGGGTPDWSYDLATNSLIRNAGGLSAGDVVEFDYRAQYPFTVTATHASYATSPWEEVIDEPKVTSIAVAQSIADSILAVRQQKSRNIFYKTHATGLEPGFFQVLNFVHRDVLSENCIVMEVNFRDTDSNTPNVNYELEYSVTSQTGFLFQSTGLWRGVYRLWAKLGGSTGSSIATPSPGGFASATPAPPPYSNQWNNFGIFGGRAEWTFVEPELLVRLYGPDAEVQLRGMIGGLTYGVPDLPTAALVQLASVTQSRLYLSATAATYEPPTFKGAWDDTSEQVTKKLTFNKPDTTTQHAQTHDTTTTGAWDMLNYRGVTDGLTAQTISGSLSAMIVAFAGAFANHEFYWHIHMYATVGDTDAVRHTFISDYRENSGDGTRFPNPVNWGGYPLGTTDPLTGVPDPIPLTSGTIQAGDRIVIEIGVVARNTLGGSFVGSVGYGARANRADASFRSAIDTSSWIDLNLANAVTDQITHAWLNVLSPLAQGDALTLQNPSDGTAWFKNDKGIYINGVFFGGAGSSPPSVINPVGGFVLPTSAPSTTNLTWWVVLIGTSPNAILALQAKVAGTVYTIASFGPI